MPIDTVEPYPARLTDAEIGLLSRLSRHESTPAPLKRWLESFGDYEVRRRLFAVNDGFEPLEVLPVELEAARWRLLDVVQSIRCLIVLQTVASRPTGAVASLLHLATVHLLLTAEAKASVLTRPWWRRLLSRLTIGQSTARAAERGPTGGDRVVPAVF